jgi:hypothetical protein
MAGVVALLAGAPLACGSLLGIDSGTPRGDASATGDDLLADVVVTPDGSDRPDVSDPPDSGSYSDVYVPVDSGPACTPDLNWCETHCGSGPDNCGEIRGCSSDCPGTEACVGNVCTCATTDGYCTGRCGETTDNCNRPIDCMTCDGGVSCYSNACGCMPEPVATTCAGKQCGSATNNCNLTVNCGASNTIDCSGSDYCKADDTCCTPDNSACNGRCQTSITNNCGQPVPCPKTCANNGVCLNSTCCTPSGCGGSCVDNCGQPNNSCCPTPPADSGSPPADSGLPPPIDAGGGCGSPGVSCSVGCCSGLCGYSFTCVTSCNGKGAGCSSPSDCCYGLSCSGVITTGVIKTLASPQIQMPFDGGVVTLGTCQ